MNLTIKKTEKETVHFEVRVDADSELTFKIYTGQSQDFLAYSTTFNVSGTGSYWIAHTCLVCSSEAKLSVFDKDDALLSEHLFSLPPDKRVLMKVNSVALGDTLCSTPTIRRVSESYGFPISVMTHRPDVFIDNPYVDNIYSFQDNLQENQFNEVFETYNHAIKVNNLQDEVKIKLSNFEARQLHALGVGMTLYPDEMSYDYFPNEMPEYLKEINKDFIALHVTESWASRTWASEKWDRLAKLIKDNTDFKIVTIGRSHKELATSGQDIIKRTISIDGIDVDHCINDDNLKYQNDFVKGKGSISDMWHTINNSFALVSFDSGPIHLAGTTDSHIVQIGASVRPEKTSPYRNGSQNYKFHYVGGSCGKFCGTDTKYSVKEWRTINALPYYPACQERYAEFLCQPTPEQVFFKICEIKEGDK